MFACEKTCRSASSPADDEGDPAGGVTSIPGTECSDREFMAPAQHFRLFMLEKFRELDVEFQRAMASETTHRHHDEQNHGFNVPALHPPGGVPICPTGKVKCNLGEAIALEIFEISESNEMRAGVHSTVTEKAPHDKAPDEGPSSMLPPKSSSEGTLSVLQPKSPSSGATPFRDLQSIHSSKSIGAGVCRTTSSGAATFGTETAPEDAFVINVRRLIDIQEKLTLLHDLLKSTAIAAITLVAAGSANQFRSTSLLFLPVVFALYHMHEQDWDSLDIEDLKMLLPLLCDDTDLASEGKEFNPNRLLKAVTVDTSRIMPICFHVFHVIVFSSLTVSWLVLEYRWRNPSNAQRGSPRRLEEPGFKAYLAEWMLEEEEDQIAIGMQLTVTSLMFLLKVIFEYIHWRETTAVMPRRQNADCDEAWDPRRHGPPRSYWLFGMPSMWFTSKESLQKLKTFIAMANPGKGRITRIYPQELAYFALSGETERIELQGALNDSKLFDGRKHKFICQGEEPQKLELSLCFFDLQLQHKSFPYPGEFMYYAREDEEYEFEPSNSNHSVARMKSNVTTNPKSLKMQKTLESLRSSQRESIQSGQKEGSTIQSRKIIQDGVQKSGSFQSSIEKPSYVTSKSTQESKMTNQSHLSMRAMKEREPAGRLK